MPEHSESFLLNTLNSLSVHINYHPLQKQTNKNSKEKKPEDKNEDDEEECVEEEKLLWPKLKATWSYANKYK